MQRRLLLSYLTITLLVLLLLEIPLGLSYAKAERRRITTGVQHDTLALAIQTEDKLESNQLSALQGIAVAAQKRIGGRVVVVDRHGVGVADSQPPPGAAPEREFANRREIRGALAGKEVTSSGHTDTVAGNFLYVAEPIIVSDGSVGGVVRVTYPLSFIDERIRHNWILLGGIAVAVLAIVFLVSLSLARSVTRPVRQLERTADQLGRGDLDARAAVPTHPPELRVLAESFNRTAARLQQLVDSQVQFVADASHQLRTPLAALRLRLENVQNELDTGDTTTADDLEGALSEVARLSRLVDGLLALARAERQSPSPGDIDVAEVVRGREAAWSAFAAERDVTIEVDVEDPCVASATPGRLEQVLDNLLNNALDVAPPASSVDLTARRDERWVVITVADAGPGMTDDAMARAFNRFWREPGRGRDGGSGLGLAIVRQLVASDGGTVSLARSARGGLEVTVRLPTSETGGARRDHEPAAGSGRRWPTRVRSTRSASV
ncbi:MAG TPA: sensor histidine kinase [Acidimicrobiia bacterium]|jgi:signal transduction histidine kinase